MRELNNDGLKDRREEALREYYHISDLIDRFDDRSLKIKSWSVTVSAAAVAFSITQNAPVLFLLAAFSALIFWILEGMWKYYQLILILHSRDIEALLNGATSMYCGPSLGAAFRRGLTWKKEKEAIPNVFWYRNVLLPHLIIIAFGVSGYVITNFSILQEKVIQAKAFFVD